MPALQLSVELGDRPASGIARRRCRLNRAPGGLALGRVGCGGSRHARPRCTVVGCAPKSGSHLTRRWRGTGFELPVRGRGQSGCRPFYAAESSDGSVRPLPRPQSVPAAHTATACAERRGRSRSPFARRRPNAYRANGQATTQNPDSLIRVENSLIARFNSLLRLEKRHEGCRTWARLAVPAAVEAPAHAVTETATKTRMHKAGASEPRMEEARVTKAEASEVWTEKAAAEPAVPASAKSDGNSDRPSPAPWVTPIPARCIIRVIPGVILWRIIRIALWLNGGASR